MFNTYFGAAQNTNMKVAFSRQINAFGGLNFVFEQLDRLGIPKLLQAQLPVLANQSKYNWKDIFYSFLSIYYCGGDSIEDIKTNLKHNIGSNPFCELPSPDRLLDRLKQLTEPSRLEQTNRGIVDHEISQNQLLSKLNVALLKKLGVFKQKQLVLDYDNTIIYTEKKDSKRTYKKEKGYQPAVATLNVNHVVYVENRNGNTDAKSLQSSTLKAILDLLAANCPCKLDCFRADAASYQFDVVALIKKYAKYFYIGAKRSYVEKYFTAVQNWEETKGSDGEKIWVGSVEYTPFIRQCKENNVALTTYRLVVKRKASKNKQLNCFTNDSFEYTAVITNDFDKTALEIYNFYNQRGSMEKQFDILKNDFGWQHVPFSQLKQNTVFLYFTAMLKNLYPTIITNLSKRFKNIQPNFRMKKFIFRFITMPAKWVRTARQNVLRIYSPIAFKT